MSENLLCLSPAAEGWRQLLKADGKAMKTLVEALLITAKSNHHSFTSVGVGKKT